MGEAWYEVGGGWGGWGGGGWGGASAARVVGGGERSGRVTDGEGPPCCVAGRTGDARFANDGLAHRPDRGWARECEAELRERGPRFLQDFGHNDVQRRG